MNLLVQISDEVLGKNAQTVVRDKATGRRRDLDVERAAQAETDAAKAVTAAKYDAWNKGQVSFLFMPTLCLWINVSPHISTVTFMASNFHRSTKMCTFHHVVLQHFQSINTVQEIEYINIIHS